MAGESAIQGNSAKLEQAVFRRLNAVVEPAVRSGIGSTTLAPASLIVLETVGSKSGLRRRTTPLWSIKLGRYRVVSTARTPAMRALVKAFHALAQKGWAFAILVPAKR